MKIIVQTDPNKNINNQHACFCKNCNPSPNCELKNAHRNREYFKSLYNCVLKYFKQKAPHFDADKHFKNILVEEQNRKAAESANIPSNIVDEVIKIKSPAALIMLAGEELNKENDDA